MSAHRRVVVVGGGAAGLIAAWRAAQRGADVVLLEKKGRLGTKILISGGGKCNVTHAGPIEQVRLRFRPAEAAFLKGPFHRFTNEDFVALLTAQGVDTYTRPDGRIFPVPPADASDVVTALERLLVGVSVRRESPVAGLSLGGDGAVDGVLLEGGGRIDAARVIVAVGGSSYPATGCTGDGWRWLSALGHSIVSLTAALAPLYLTESAAWRAEWSGVALRDCVLKARRVGADGAAGKERIRWRGDLLFTHKGVSGPCALGVAREIAEASPEPSSVEVDLLPDVAFETLASTLADWCRQHPRRAVAGFVDERAPERLGPILLSSAGIDPAQRGAYLTAKERSRLANVLKGWSLGVVRAVPLERGEVVAGGVALGEVDPRTMASRKIPGLYLCGEVLDIAGPVGGYNLQAAWSTGFVAGDAAGE